MQASDDEKAALCGLVASTMVGLLVARPAGAAVGVLIGGAWAGTATKGG